ncbi:MAG: CRISPR system precrRNA processing endoribonuclease RAMP protein Cas6 [Deltaproteobacteria bacterium]|nr:CRISPR system precrRNA processing endoribonuclease RAMP protein Cas6 [Deltaproteobacteria bacterium]
MDFNLAHLVLTLRTADPADCLARLFGGRAAFEAAFRDLACCRAGRECRACDCRCDCPYWRVFGQELAVDPEIVRRHQKPGVPFAFRLPLPTAAVKSDRCEAGLVLVGPAVELAPLFCRALDRLLADGGGGTRIELVCSQDYQGRSNPLAPDGRGWDCAGLVVMSAAAVRLLGQCYAERLRITLETPLKLVNSGRELRVFDPSLFCRTVIRRVSSLAAYYGEEGEGEEFRRLAEQARGVRLIAGNFVCGAPSGLSARYGGMSGHGLLGGGVGELAELLRLGMLFNLGKGAAFGLGRYRVEPEGGST